MGRQQADDREPAQVADAHRHQRDVADDQDRAPRRHEPLVVAEHQGADRDRQRGDQQLPAGQHGGRHLHLAALQDQRADRPADAGEQPERQAERRLRIGSEALPHQQRDGERTQRDRQHEAAAQTFAQHGPADQRRPQRHREAEHRRLPRGDQQRRVGARDVPHHEVEEGGHGDRAPVAARDHERLTHHARRDQQRHAGDQHRHRAKGPHRHLARGQREQRPVGAPHQPQDRQQHQRARRDALRHLRVAAHELRGGQSTASTRRCCGP